jgi:hypothetical protein
VLGGNNPDQFRRPGAPGLEIAKERVTAPNPFGFNEPPGMENRSPTCAGIIAGFLPSPGAPRGKKGFSAS